GACLEVWQPCADGIATLAFHREAELVIVAACDRSLGLLELSTGALRVLRKPRLYAPALIARHQKGHLCAAWSYDRRTLRVTDVDDDKPIAIVQCRDGCVTALDFDSDASQLWVASSGGQVGAYDLTGRCLGSVAVGTSTITVLAHVDGSRVA